MAIFWGNYQNSIKKNFFILKILKTFLYLCNTKNRIFIKKKYTITLNPFEFINIKKINLKLYKLKKIRISLVWIEIIYKVSYLILY
jgi:hypothetical protein